MIEIGAADAVSIFNGCSLQFGRGKGQSEKGGTRGGSARGAHAEIKQTKI